MAIISDDQIDEGTVLNKIRFFNVLDVGCNDFEKITDGKKSKVSALSIPELFPNWGFLKDIPSLFAH